ncbi:VOC family protein [Acidimangrovimonas pyrenivorans]|uniref:VOC family protein n=1 Tax=Acidimangrovimonas pyrenivorans TaxID=2030798 RepID=A0ABV7AI82_9RHOB
MAPNDAPLTVARIALTVNDLDKVADFYAGTIGLTPLRRDGETALLGAGERPLIELRRDPAARQRDPREAGLFHTAFLLLGDADLGRWLRALAENRTPIQGASDHGVSKAVYLADPEGNGIEVYADRAPADWPRKGDGLAMGTEPLDLPGLIAGIESRWTGAPEGTVIGHVHLQVGALDAAEAFWTGRLGLDVTQHYPGAGFFSSGGYHHHVGTNVWNSRGAPIRADAATGLAEVTLAAAAGHRAKIGVAEGETLRDPWNIPVTVVAQAA